MTMKEKLEKRLDAREVQRRVTKKHAMPGSQTDGYLLLSEGLDDMVRTLASFCGVLEEIDEVKKPESEADLGEVTENGPDEPPEKEAEAPVEKNNSVTEKQG